MVLANHIYADPLATPTLWIQALAEMLHTHPQGEPDQLEALPTELAADAIMDYPEYGYFTAAQPPSL